MTLNLSSNLIANSNDETNFPHKLLLTYKQVSKFCKAFANGSPANIKFSNKVKGGFLSILLGTLAASTLGNVLPGRGVTKAGEGTIRAGRIFNATSSFN